MKKIKISFIAVIALIIGATSGAFNAPSSNIRLDDGWFQIINASAPNSADSYEYVGSTAPCSGLEQVLCAIKGTRDVVNPDHPTQADVDNASALSNGFTKPVSNFVAFKMQ